MLNGNNNRLIIEEGEKPIRISSISRGSSTLYEGNLELSIVNNRLLVINDILMEDYLKKVVPSEMPASWNMEALKSQAVAARTYAYREIYLKKYMNEGYIVDDSESSQVYNNSNDQPSTNQAVLETKGITMFCENQPIIAYYYSSSSGLCGKGNEVWITNKVIEDIPYLQGGNTTNMEVDTSSEDDLLKLKNLSFVKYVCQTENKSALQEREKGFCEVIICGESACELQSYIVKIEKDFSTEAEKSLFINAKEMLLLCF